MHSKPAPKRLRRMTPYLITAGVGLSVATASVASPDEEQSKEAMESEIPAPTIDTNGDGTPDAWDRSGDGKPDAWDTNGDGRPDLLDDDGDGQPD
ncbi:MAG: hypothetical protein ABJN65_10835 [Parasphingorhabdus sp.]